MVRLRPGIYSESVSPDVQRAIAKREQAEREQRIEQEPECASSDEPRAQPLDVGVGRGKEPF